MKIKTTFLLLVFSSLLTLSLSNAVAQYEPHTQVGLPKGAVARFGTGPFWGVFEYIFAYSPNAVVPQFAVPGILGIWLYDAETLQVQGLLHAPYPDVFCMSYSLDGKLLATGHYDGNIRLWNLRTTELDMTFIPNPTVAYWDETDKLYRHTFTRHERIIRSVTFSPDGNLLAAGIDNGTIELWDVNTGEVRILEGHNETVDVSVKMRVSFSNDGSTLASTSKYSEVHLWDVVTGKFRKTLGEQSWGAESASFNPDGNTMATYNHAGILHLWDVATYELLKTFENPPELIDHINSDANITFSPDGGTIVTLTYNTVSHKQALYLSDVSTGTLRDILRGPYFWVEYMSYSPDGSTLVVTTDRGIFLWDVATGEIRDRLVGNVLNPHTAISPDGETLATGRLLWDISTGTLRKDALLDSPEVFLSYTGSTGIKNVSFSPDGKTLAIAEFNRVMLFDVTTGTLLHTINGHVGRPQDAESMAFSPDSSLLATGSVFDSLGKGELFLWNVATGQQKKNFIEHVGNVYSLSFSPDGKTLAAGIDDTVHLMDAATGEISNTFPRKGRNVYSLSFSPDGKTLATGSDDKVRLWDVATGTIRTTFDTIFQEHTPNIWSVKFSPDGRTLAASIYNTVHLWDVATNDIKTILKGHVDDVYSVNFSPNGNLLTSGSVDGTVLLWEIRVSKQLKEDINDDGVVNIQDLVMVAAQFGQTGDNKVDQTGNNKVDVNGDGVVNIKDLVLVAGAFGNIPATPTLWHHAKELLTPEIVQQWIEAAKQWNLTNATSQRGIAVLEVLMTALTPKETTLLPNYPNPFNPETWIPYQLSEPAEVILRIYAVNGTLVRTLALGYQPAGIYQTRTRAAYWDGKNDLGESVASGVYFYTLTAGDFNATRKMLIRK